MPSLPPVAVRRPPWFLMVPASVCAVGVLIPLAYLVFRGLEAEAATLAEAIFRWRNLVLLKNTLLLSAAVLALTTLLAMPMAHAVVRPNLPGRRILTLLAVLPLAVPGYLMAFTLLGLGGQYGLPARLWGIEMPRLSGFSGAVIALSLANFPYMFLNLRVGFQRLNPALEEASQSLGRSAFSTFCHVVLPQLRPSLLAGGLLVTLHVAGDFGVVGLMRFESFSYALYLEYGVLGDRVYAAWLALMLVVLTVGLLAVDLVLLGRLRLEPTGGGSVARRPARLGWRALPVYGLFAIVAVAGVVVPAGAILLWLARRPETAQAGWLSALLNSVAAALPAALLATALAIPVASLARRYPSVWSRGLERVAYLGYAVPGLAFALGVVFFCLRTAPWLYQTLTLLVLAYGLHFLAEAVGPIRSALFVATPRLEEAARSLGRGPVATFLLVTLPLLRGGLVTSAALVFLSTMKELPLAIILSPPGFDTLAANVFSLTSEAMFARAAPYALAILLFSAVFVGLLLFRSTEEAT